MVVTALPEMTAAQLSQAERGRLVIERQPDLAARIVGAALDASVLVDRHGREAARLDLHAVSRLTRRALPHLACD